MKPEGKTAETPAASAVVVVVVVVVVVETTTTIFLYFFLSFYIYKGTMRMFFARLAYIILQISELNPFFTFKNHQKSPFFVHFRAFFAHFCTIFV